MTKPLNKETLEDVALWLDTSDSLLRDYADLLEWCVKYKLFDDPNFDKQERLIELIRKTCTGTEMQDDIRNWAKWLANPLDYDSCPYDCSYCHDD